LDGDRPTRSAGGLRGVAEDFGSTEALGTERLRDDALDGRECAFVGRSCDSVTPPERDDPGVIAVGFERRAAAQRLPEAVVDRGPPRPNAARGCAALPLDL